MKADITRKEHIRQAKERTLEKLGRIDVPVNNAGIVKTGNLEHAYLRDIVNAAVFLALDQSSLITGVLLNVDGARHMAVNTASD